MKHKEKILTSTWYQYHTFTVRFRYDPVPKTGKRRYSGLQNFRHPRTTREHRENSGTLHDKKTIEEELLPGPRRSRKQLPTSWDDIPRLPQKNWKKQRKTQYKLPKKPS